jgi:DNA repair protein RadD
MKLKPRPYQEEAIKAVNAALKSREDNPAIVLPTGAGKSLVMALLVDQWLSKCPHLKVMVLAHRKELVEQNALELSGLNPEIDVGVFAASLRRRETLCSVTFASIDSIAKRAEDFPPQDVLLIDEAHRIPVKGEGKYRKFIDAMRGRNPRLRVVGLTATPYRMSTGAICHRDHILNHVCYEAQVGNLIDSGYLSKIRTVEGDHSTLDLQGVKKTAGEFNLKDLAIRVDKTEVVAEAVKDMTEKVRQGKRKSVIVFCIDVEHCKSVQRELRKFGVDAPYIVGKTAIKERERLVDDFKEGRFQWLLSVDCFFEGFNAKRVDCVVMLRPTQSKGLWVQAIGRGLRLHPEKEDCLVLDYGENIIRHGPIDWSDDEAPKLATCGNCDNMFSRAIRKCPCCGWEIPPVQREMFAAEEERERTMHNARAQAGQLLAKPRWLDVNSVALRLHKKAGKPDSVRVEYFCGLSIIKEWLLLDHGSYASTKSHKWLRARGLPIYGSSAEMLEQCSGEKIQKVVKRLKVKYQGKYQNVVECEVEIKGIRAKIKC